MRQLEPFTGIERCLHAHPLYPIISHPSVFVQVFVCVAGLSTYTYICSAGVNSGLGAPSEKPKLKSMHVQEVSILMGDSM